MKNSKTSRPPTATDVAKLAGVSQPVVSRAFMPDTNIAEKTREKVLKAAKQLGYRPNLLARSLRMNKSNIIALAISYLENPFYAQVVKELSEQLRATDRHILLFTAPDDNQADPALAKVLNYQVDALVMSGTKASRELAISFKKLGVPIVQINRDSNYPGVSTVQGEDRDAGRIIGRHLLAGGHKRFGFVSGIADSSTSLFRLEGYREYLQSHGIDDVQIAYGNNTFEAAANAVRQLLGSKTPPDAIFCASDYMAFAALEVAKKEFGLKVPDDLSVVGFNDVPAASLSAHDLTTFSQPAATMVEKAIVLVDQLISGQKSRAQHLIVKGELIVRGSSRQAVS
ncbi:MAG: LacI family DNA-binding transcriptional regulator [Rhizobiaceae bacterium]|nr:LacI family DNA-binding transcriptional regulator [Rhizobiaceae bacterium]